MTFSKLINFYSNSILVSDKLNQFKCSTDDVKFKILELNTVARLVTPAIGTLDLVDIDAGSVLQIYNRMRRSNFSEFCVRRLHTALYDIFDDAVFQGLISENPIRYLHLEELRSLPKEFYAPDELEKIICGIDSSKYCNIYKFLLHTGLKLNEVLALSVSDIDWEKGLVSIRKLVSVRSGNYKITRNIAEYKIRSFYLTKNALQILIKEMEHRKEKELNARRWKNEEDVIFCEDDGSFIRSNKPDRESVRLFGDSRASCLYRQFEIGTYQFLSEVVSHGGS